MKEKKNWMQNLHLLPVLSTARVCELAGCHRSTVKRSPMIPVGRRGKTLMYKTSDVLAWISGTLTPPTHEQQHDRKAADTAAALERLAVIRSGIRNEWD
jgi:hypothetical protein